MEAAADLRSLAETAAFFDISSPTLKRWIDAGAPVAERGSNGVAYQLSLTAVAAWRREQRTAEEQAEAAKAQLTNQLRLELLGGEALTAGETEAALSQAQRAAALQAEVARTKLAQLRRELVPAEEIALAFGLVWAALKTRLRQISDTAAPELGLTEAQQAHLAELVDVALAEAVEAGEAALHAAP